MIQDQYDPEYFIGSFQEVETATGRRSQRFVKYADVIEQRPGFFNDFEADSSKTLDRLVTPYDRDAFYLANDPSRKQMTEI